MEMTIEELLKALDPIPDDWTLAPYGQLQGVMDGSWKQIFIVHLKRYYRYRDSKRPYSYSELAGPGGPQLDQVVLYAQKHHTYQSETTYGK